MYTYIYVYIHCMPCVITSHDIQKPICDMKRPIQRSKKANPVTHNDIFTHDVQRPLYDTKRPIF